MSNKTLICVLQLWSICSTVIAMTFKRSQLELTINLDKKIYYGNGNTVPFLQLKKSLTSLCALTSLLQLRSIFVYEALKKQYHLAFNHFPYKAATQLWRRQHSKNRKFWTLKLLLRHTTVKPRRERSSKKEFSYTAINHLKRAQKVFRHLDSEWVGMLIYMLFVICVLKSSVCLNTNDIWKKTSLIDRQ